MIIRVGCFILLILLLISCSVFSPIHVTPDTIYVLNGINTTHFNTPPTHSTLLITPPQTTRIYDTNQMVYVNKPYQIGYFSHNRWADTPAQMLVPLMVQSLRNSGHFRAVVVAPFNGNYNLILNTQLIELQQNFLQHPSQVQLKLYAQLLNGVTQRVIATREFSETVSAPSDDPYGGVVAANKAVAQMMQQLTFFCIKSSS